jgi:alpha-beta hydrolase superfamily lysophospholipase
VSRSGFDAFTVDVTDTVALGEPLELAGWLFRPDPARDRRTVLFCYPGGGWTKAYWHLEVAGQEGYSFAEHMVGRGYAVVTFDHLAVGESSKPRDPFSVTTQIVASANARLVEHVLDVLGDPGARRVGIGHSMGGMLLIRQQGRLRTFDAVAVLGFSTLYPMNLEGLIDQSPFEHLTEAALRGVRDHMPDPYAVFDKDHARGLFVHPDVPDVVLAARNAAGTNSPGAAGAASLIPGIVADDAAAIDVPVFCGWAERDTSIDPHREVASYPGSRDVTLYVLAGSAHTTNLGATRRELWGRIASWIETVVPSGS